MCGRFAFYSPAEATAALFGATATSDFKPRYNIAPTQDIAAVRNDTEQSAELVALRWGLVPFWAKDPSIGNRMINARAETVAEKPSFRAAYKNRRCLILADGFYEWRKEGDGKTPYFISLASGEPFAFAGLWENWTDKESGESLQTAAIITMAANEYMSGLHQRMPVVLQPDFSSRWLAGDKELLDEVAANSPEFRAWPVDRRVNNARNEGEDLIVADGPAYAP
ncbi:MAG: SOS response-associated peptidase [Gammaproteobacteria bacterium]|nr:SOS response-associated peptidase [Gammaproteobacteria bacterium]